MGNAADKIGRCSNGALQMEDLDAEDSQRYAPPTKTDIDELAEHRKRVSESIESVEARTKRYLHALTPSLEDLTRMYEAFVDELIRGLECHESHPNEWVPQECSFKMLDSCINSSPSGLERGVYYALDFGGTNFRVVRVAFEDAGELDIKNHIVSLLDAPGTEHLEKRLLSRHATAMQMFDFFALEVRRVMMIENDYDDRMDENDEPILGKEVSVGFTFSFPCSQRKIDSGVMITWTKGFETGRDSIDPIEGNDVVELMNISLRRNNVPAIVVGLLNDTVGTQLSAGFDSMQDRKSKSTCCSGLILGTGFNICYSDHEAFSYGYQGTIINVESGNFNRELPQCNIDLELDFDDTAGRGQQQLEKMVAGAYLGEIIRRTFVNILQHHAPVNAWEQWSLSSVNASAIYQDRSSSNIVAKNYARGNWGADLPHEELALLKQICVAVFERSASLAAVVICGVAERTGRLQSALGGVTVGIDGSLYKLNALYREKLRRTIDQLIGLEKGSLIHLSNAEDGSGRGAGILAAVIA